MKTLTLLNHLCKLILSAFICFSFSEGKISQIEEDEIDSMIRNYEFGIILIL